MFHVKNLLFLVPLVVGPDEVTLQGVGELREGVWETRGFTFRVLLIPSGPFTEVGTASEAMLPRVPLLKALEFRSLSLGCLGSARSLNFSNSSSVSVGFSSRILDRGSSASISRFTLPFQEAKSLLNMPMA